MDEEAIYEMLKTEEFYEFFNEQFQLHLMDLENSPSKETVLAKIKELFAK
jgi:hypothetical protein